MKCLDVRSAEFESHFRELLGRGEMDMSEMLPLVQGLLDDIRARGGSAVCEQVARFDSWSPRDFSELAISPAMCEAAYNTLDSKLKSALNLAYERITRFHEAHKPSSTLNYESSGTMLGVRYTPMRRAGLYIPGGKAAYPSSVLMNAIPALVAGVEEIILCTPAPHNELNPLLLAALHLCRITHAYKVGGASAIGLMAYGAQGCPRVDVISGPGNIFVATAKKLVFGEVQIDMIAGPSEIAIIADSSANARYIALDMLSQAEHDERASAIVLSDDGALLESVRGHIDTILPTMERESIARASINNRAVMIHTRSLQESIELANALAPEHLEILTASPFESLPHIRHAGAVFLGEYSSEPMGDYIAGPNHTLPTGGCSRFFSPLSVETFMKKSSVISISKQGFKELGESCVALAQSEGLHAHAQAISERLDSFSSDSLLLDSIPKANNV